MELVQGKTHLISLLPKKFVDSGKILFNGVKIQPSISVEHLGILRSASLSNMSAIHDRLSKHKKALFPVLCCGAALGHDGNPAASLKVEEIYASPVLYNGLGGLVLSNQELDVLQHHQKTVLQQLMGLYPKTPHEAVCFLSGVPPSRGLVALRMFSLLGMISRLGPGNYLYEIGIHQLHHQVSSSWFMRLQELAHMYGLPDPLTILCNPVSPSCILRRGQNLS